MLALPRKLLAFTLRWLQAFFIAHLFLAGVRWTQQGVEKRLALLPVQERQAVLKKAVPN